MRSLIVRVSSIVGMTLHGDGQKIYNLPASLSSNEGTKASVALLSCNFRPEEATNELQPNDLRGSNSGPSPLWSLEVWPRLA